MSAVKVNGSWRQIEDIKVKIDDAWVSYSQLYAKVENEWQLIDITQEASGPKVHTWKAYADDDLGNGISLDPTGKEYLGLASEQSVPQSEAADSTVDPSIYTWSKIKGDRGDAATITDNGDGTYTITGGNGSFTYADASNVAPITITDNGDGTFTLDNGSGQTAVVTDGYTPLFGVDYIDGNDGTFHSYIYKVVGENDPPPDTPTGGSFDGVVEGIPAGWTDTSTYTGVGVEYRSLNRYHNTKTWVNDELVSTWTIEGPWSEPKIFTKVGDQGPVGPAPVVMRVGDTVTITSGEETVTVYDGINAPIPTVTDNGDGTVTIDNGDGQTAVVRDGDPGDPGYTPLKGVDYFDGLDGKYYSKIFKIVGEGDPAPDKPVGGSFDGQNETLPSGWTDTPQYNGTGIEYISVNRYSNLSGSTWTRDGSWSTPAIFARKGDIPTVTRVGDTVTIVGGNGSVTVKDGVSAPAPTITDNGDGTVTINNQSGQSVTFDKGFIPELGVDYFDGANGDFISIIYRVTSGSTPSTPTGGFFNGSTEDLPTSWSDTRPNISSGQVRWVSSRRYRENVTYADGVRSSNWTNVGPWSTPVEDSIQGIQGIQGVQGPTGAGGAGWFPTTAHATANGRQRVVNDIAGSGSSAVRWNGSAWEPFGAFIASGLLVDGAVVARVIGAGAVSAEKIDVDDLFAQEITATGFIRYEKGSLSSQFGGDALLNLTGSNGVAVLVDNEGNFTFDGRGVIPSSIPLGALHSDEIDRILSFMGAAAPSTGGTRSTTFSFDSPGTFTLSSLPHGPNAITLRVSGAMLKSNPNKPPDSSVTFVIESSTDNANWSTVTSRTVTKAAVQDENSWITNFIFNEEHTYNPADGTYYFRVRTTSLSGITKLINATFSAEEVGSGGATGATTYYAGTDLGLSGDTFNVESAVSAAANKIAKRDGNGNLKAHSISLDVGNTGASVTKFYVDTGDGFIRPATIAHVRNQLGQMNDSAKLGGIASDKFLRSDVNDTTTGNLIINKNGTNNLELRRTTNNQYAGMSFTESNGQARWLFYMGNVANPKLSFQARPADNSSTRNVMDLDNVTHIVNFAEIPTVGGTTQVAMPNVNNSFSVDQTFQNHIELEGNLYKKGSGSLIIQNDNYGQELYLRGRTNEGAVYTLIQGLMGSNSGSVKFFTNNSAVGEFTHQAFRVGASMNSGDYLEMVHTGVTAYLQSNEGDLDIRNYDSGSNIYMRATTDDGNLHIGLGVIPTSTGTYTQLRKDNATVAYTEGDGMRFGSNPFADSVRVRHDGTNGYVQNEGGHLYIRNVSQGKQIYMMVANSDGSNSFPVRAIGSSSNGYTELYYGDNKKLATKNGGVDVTGRLTFDSDDSIGISRSGQYMKWTSDFGESTIGMGSSSWCHFNTDASSGFYFYKAINTNNQSINAGTATVTAARFAGTADKVTVQNHTSNNQWYNVVWDNGSDTLYSNTKMQHNPGTGGLRTSGELFTDVIMTRNAGGMIVAGGELAPVVAANQSLSVEWMHIGCEKGVKAWSAPNNDVNYGNLKSVTLIDDSGKSEFNEVAVNGQLNVTKAGGAQPAALIKQTGGHSVLGLVGSTDTGSFRLEANTGGELRIQTGTTDGYYSVANGDKGTIVTFFRDGHVTFGGIVYAVNHVHTSDKRVKKDFADIDNPLEKLDKLKGCTYTQIKTGKRNAGIIAQDLQEILPEGVTTGPDGLLAVDDAATIALLVESVKALKARVEALEAAR